MRYLSVDSKTPRWNPFFVYVPANGSLVHGQICSGSREFYAWNVLKRVFRMVSDFCRIRENMELERRREPLTQKLMSVFFFVFFGLVFTVTLRCLILETFGKFLRRTVTYGA